MNISSVPRSSIDPFDVLQEYEFCRDGDEFRHS